jgi:hypothetical protein
MSDDSQMLSGAGASRTRRRLIGPILTLLVLSPMIGEVMSGATRLSYIVVLVPEIMVWGCGTLIIREVVRRWQGSWTSVLLLGFGLSVAEEFVIQQTSIAPLPWSGAAAGYDRLWGVNWLYFIFMLGYEAIWIVLVPVQIVELIFPERRREPWLGARGLVIAAGVFLAGCFIAWFLWTQRARPMAFHVPIYHPPIATVLSGLLAIILLAAAARWARRFAHSVSPGEAPRPWLVASAAFLLGLPWYSLMAVVFAPKQPAIPLWVPVAIACAWATGVFYVIERWALRSGWRDMHRWALCFGALIVCMVGGFLGAAAWPIMDVVAKAILNVIAIVCMAVLALRIAKRSRAVGDAYR